MGAENIKLQVSNMFFSVVVPTFSRPDEVAELLASLNAQYNRNFEVIIADGSPDNSVEDVVGKFRNILEITYLHKKGLGISESRNWGAESARGDYVVFFDSDCVIPEQYFKVVNEFLTLNGFDAYGGPDRAGETFSKRQKAISYAMTSFFTTGGIRGRKRHIGNYQPRTFNMGIRKSVFKALGGFSGLKVSEDIDLSLRLYKQEYQVGLIEEAYEARKSPFKLAKMLGPKFIFKFLLRRLTIEELEERISSLIKAKGKAVVTSYPEIGMDVDKNSDLELARKMLQ